MFILEKQFMLVDLIFCPLLQCNKARTEDAPAADISLSNQMTSAKKGSEAGWFTLLLLVGVVEYYLL